MNDPRKFELLIEVLFRKDVFFKTHEFNIFQVIFPDFIMNMQVLKKQRTGGGEERKQMSWIVLNPRSLRAIDLRWVPQLMASQQIIGDQAQTQ